MCVVWKNSRQFNEVILSQMDLFFIIKKKKVYEENQVFHFKDLGMLSWKLTNI